MDAAARRRTYDIPKSDSVGLAEWTSKIKALQRQVDEDEEAETRRLEEEIMASRVSRMRRSTLQPRPLSHDPSTNKLPRVASPASDIDHPQSAGDKQRDREATMRKLMGQRSPVMLDFPRLKNPLDNPPPAPPKPSSSTNGSRHEPISLAAFMGSRETGPRMNKHAPQQDAHDPTQFGQRSTTSPHPVFGKNGVAMPGLAPRSPGSQSRTSPRLPDAEVSSPIQSTPPSNLRERKTSTPAVARRYVEKIEIELMYPQLSPSPKFRDTREHIRERTMSTPSGPGPSSQRSTSPPKPSPSGVGHIFTNKQSSSHPQAHNNLSTPSTAKLHRHSYSPRPIGNGAKPDLPRKTFPSISQPGRTEADPSPRSKSPTLSVSTPNFRRSPSPSMMPVSPLRPATTINTPTLARPVEPKPKPSLHGPKIISFSRSPAFSDRTPPKGATPSLSRLQGRGFVQNMVKASAELESSTGSSPAPTPERARSEPQKTFVLDRWSGSTSAISTPMVSSTPVLMRKAKTFDPINVTASGSPGVSQSPRVQKPVSMPRRKSQTFEKGLDGTPPLSKSPSKGILVTPKKEGKPPPTTPPATSNGRVVGLGSSNTLVSYIKPMKTGDSEPPSPVRSKTPTANDGADELGIRERKSSGKLREKSVSFAASPPRSKAKSMVDVLPSPAKPLSHPTKDRAKKPKRVKITSVVVKGNKQPVSVSGSEIPSNFVNSDPLESSGVSPGPASPTSPLPKHPPTGLDLPPPSPITFVPPSGPGPAQPSKSRSPSPQSPVRSSGKTLPPKEHSPPSTQPKIVDKWGNGPIIGVKPVLNGKGHPSSSSTSPLPTPTKGAFGQIALPGLSTACTPCPPGVDKLEDRVSPFPVRETPQETPEERRNGKRKPSADKPQPRRPPVSHKPSRIPSTGNRARVMDVAQVWSLHEKQSSQDVTSPRSASPNSPLDPVQPVGIQAGLDRQREPESERERARGTREREETPKVDAKTPISGSGIQSTSKASIAETPNESEEKDASLKLPDLLSPAEKMKSSWEKYSEFIMPPLEEEWTPAHSCVPTLNKRPEAPEEPKDLVTAPIPETKGLEESKVDYLPIDLLSTILDPERKIIRVAPTDLVTFGFPNYAVPKIDVRPLLKSILKPSPADPGVATVSVDVLSIAGSVSSAVSSDTSVFYDTEILAIIQRAKVKSSGLVDTKIWGWIGRDAKVGLKEEKALTDLAKRYGTKLVSVEQYHEPFDMVTVLGGTLAIRQGTRAHWSPENTAMHLVRSTNGVMFIDEQHPSVQSLCSGFSYCLSILQMFYVWNGRGARPDEKKAAFDYAASLCGDADSVIVLDEGENDEDEMFWAVLGDGDRDYAKASCWAWRASANAYDPQLWKITASPSHQFTHIPTTANPPLEDSVFILDIVWEVFVLVGAEARGKREDILLALATAKALVSSVELLRPFAPPIHVLVFPSRVPQDLRLAARGLGFYVQEGDKVAEHMNVLSVSQALDHMNMRRWHKAALSDRTLLPLGLSPNDLN